MEPIIEKITISKGTQPSAFDPKVEVIQPNDSVFWVNETDTAHQPAPDAGTAQWVKAPIASGHSCPQVVFQVSGAFPYHCATHPDDPREKGTILVSGLSEIRRDDDVQVTFDTVTVPPGGYVNWANRDPQGKPHQPDFVPSPIAPQTRSAPVQFKTPGVFAYKCKLHTGEEGTIIVPATIEIKRDGGQVTFDAVTVAPGDSVTWANRDKERHQPDLLPRPIPPQGTSAPVQFKTAGVFDYTCKLHAGEKGTVTVKA